MIKRLKLVLLTLSIGIVVAGCKKEISQEFVSETSCKLTQVDYEYNGVPDGTLKYTYDTEGKIVSYDNEDEVVPYVYNGSKITLTPKLDPYTVTLVNGKVVKLELTNSNVYWDYTYDADGYLTEVREYKGTVMRGKEVLTYTNNNLSKIVGTYSDGTIYTKINEFSSEIVSSNSLYIDPLGDAVVDYDFPTMGYFGKLSKNMVVKSTTTGTRNSTVFTIAYNFTYKKDSANKCISRTTSSTTTSTTNGVVGPPISYSEAFHFTYECK